MQRTECLSFRNMFMPASVKLVVVAESPPISGKYFYNPEGAITVTLFRAFMKQIGVEPKTKNDGLLAFQKAGWVLVDATYEPVNANQKRDDVIVRDYP
jgi:hypothetical protein